jgi:hypothetical protein
MPSHEEIDRLGEQLYTSRQALALYTYQEIQYGGEVFAPLVILNRKGIAIDDIQRIKTAFRGWGIAIKDFNESDTLPDQEDINRHLRWLAIRRERLKQLSDQLPVSEVSEIRTQIWRIKMNLWNWSVSFEDHFDEDMFIDEQDIERQQELIANHIKSLYDNEEEMAIYGGAISVPFNIYRDILIARQVISYAYARMQKWGVKNVNPVGTYDFMDSSVPMWIPSAMATLSLNGSSVVLALRSVRIFLCHSSKDKLVVRGLYDRLWLDGFQPWLDEKDIMAGQDWNTEIMKAVQASDVVLVCLSQAAITKAGYVQKEIRVALDVADIQPENTIFIIPVKLEDCAVPMRLSKYQWVNLYEEYGYERLIRALRARSALL